MDKPIKVTTVIDKYLYKKAAAPLPYTPAPAFSPSKLGTLCLRRMYYDYLRTEMDQPFQSFLLRIFKTGNIVHDMIQEWLMETNQLIPYRNKDGSIPKSRWTGKPDIEFPVKDKNLEIKGKIDGIGIIDNELWIYEIKSINADKFKALKVPQQDHIDQAMIYNYLFETALQQGQYAHIPELKGWYKVSGIIFIYFNKNTSFFKEFRVEPNILTFEKILRKIALVKQYVNNDELPPPTKAICEQCPFAKKCAQDMKISKTPA